MNLKQLIRLVRQNPTWRMFPDFLMLAGVAGSLLYFAYTMLLFGGVANEMTEQQLMLMADVVSVSGVASLSLCVAFAVVGAYWKLSQIEKQTRKEKE